MTNFSVIVVVVNFIKITARKWCLRLVQINILTILSCSQTSWSSECLSTSHLVYWINISWYQVSALFNMSQIVTFPPHLTSHPHSDANKKIFFSSFAPLAPHLDKLHPTVFNCTKYSFFYFQEIIKLNQLLFLDNYYYWESQYKVWISSVSLQNCIEFIYKIRYNYCFWLRNFP